jgi:hypothetical protein
LRIFGKVNDGRQSLKVGVVFADLQPGQTKILRHQRCLWGYWLYIAALRLDDGSLLVVATQTAPTSAITDYAKRWGIETVFGIFKTRGFCLESTHLKDSERLSKLLALLSLALCWVILTGNGYTNLNHSLSKSMDVKLRAFFAMALTICGTLFSIWSRKWMIS